MAAATTAKNGCKRRRWPLLLVPYLVGIVWTSIHPVISIITGELKCRGLFIDESSLDIGSLRADSRYNLAARKTKQGSALLCDSLLKSRIASDAIECFRHEDEFHVAKIVPVSGAVEPAETLVIVVPSPPVGSSWMTSDFHNAILQLVERLSSPSSCPWLAKTVLIVSPTRDDASLDSTVSLFLDAYLGSTSGNISPLPMSYSFGILRNLLVVDIKVNETENTGTELRILPQGRNGVLPNLDLVFATMSALSRCSFLGANSNLIMHSYGRASNEWKHKIPSSLSPFAQQWAYELVSMLLFSYHLAMGPDTSHHVALEKGIDSLTIEADFYGPQARSNAVESVEKLEILTRAISNLHERLHHSITQYLLPSPTKFVSHAEYLIPNLLLLLPLVVRAVTLVFFDMASFDMLALQTVLMVGLVSVFLSVVAVRTNNVSIMNALYVIVYVSLCFYMPDWSVSKQRKVYGQSLQFATCLVAIYMHVPLVLAHASLAFPSALVWSAAIAFPAFPIAKQGTVWHRLKMQVVLAFAMLSLVLVPNVIFGGYSLFVTTVYMPLHLLVTLLWLV